jgi:aspartate-semialdehyde dehydrogenase
MSAGEPIVVVVGATGLVGQELLGVLAERQFPAAEVRALASAESAGTRVEFGDRELIVRGLDDAELRGADVVFLCAGSEVSARYAKRIAAAGALVIDLGGHFVEHPAVPLVVPEVNLRRLPAGGAVHLVAVPGAATSALAAVLHPLDQVAGVRLVNVATYEPVSGIGRAGVMEFGEEATRLLGGLEARPGLFSGRMAFSCIPLVGVLDASGESAAERALRIGLRRILDRPQLPVIATAVRVPTFFGVGAAVAVELERPVQAEAARDVLREAPSVVMSEDDGVSTYDVVGSDAIHVGRVREHAEQPGWLGLWVAVDNTRKAAATNAVVIAEALRRSVH